jgi:hypothetical protein
VGLLFNNLSSSVATSANVDSIWQEGSDRRMDFDRKILLFALAA